MLVAGTPTWSAKRQMWTLTKGASPPVALGRTPMLKANCENRAGELNSDELERLVTIIQNPTQFKIPTWFLNRQRDIVDGKNSQILSNGVDSKLRDDLERLKKIRAHRGLRHFWGLRVRGQHTKTTGSFSHRFKSPDLTHVSYFRSSWKDRRCLQEAWLSDSLLLSIYHYCLCISIFPQPCDMQFVMSRLSCHHIRNTMRQCTSLVQIGSVPVTILQRRNSKRRSEHLRGT